MKRTTCLVLALIAFPALGQEPVALVERMAVGSEYRVLTRVDLKGELTVPVDKDTPAQVVKMTGKSSIDYDERILPAGDAGADQKSVRQYRTIDFRRMIGDRPQEISLRLEVRRLVVLKRGHAKVPFSPDGPLTWGEIDMLRTDLFVPALAGLLPEKPVKVGGSWRASQLAVAELTDMEKIERGQVVCQFEEEQVINGRRVAHITFAGDLVGINEDGPTRQKLSGRLYFDLTSSFISYISINGEHYLLDKDGRENGKIAGEFVLVRQLNPRNAHITDAALAKLTIDPNSDNTLLLYEESDLGVRMLHPRRWRVGRVARGQITLDEAHGSGLLITVEPAIRVPTAADYASEARRFLDKQKSNVLAARAPCALQLLPPSWISFPTKPRWTGSGLSWII